jgi:hypothetical protein
MVADRIADAMNAHDVDAFVACLHEDYDSRQPAHPDRAFRGSDQVRQNWSAIFASVEDFRAELVRAAAVGDVEWSEWRWRGTGLDMAGVIVFGIRDGRAAWARLYVEPVEQAGAGIDAAVRDMTGEPPGMAAGMDDQVKPSEQRGGTTAGEDEVREKGEWTRSATGEGVVPAELGGSDAPKDDEPAYLGRTVGGDEPATEEGIDLSAGDNADATTQGGQNRPEDEEPDLRDVSGGPRKVDLDSAD